VQGMACSFSVLNGIPLSAHSNMHIVTDLTVIVSIHAVVALPVVVVVVVIRVMRDESKFWGSFLIGNSSVFAL